MPERQSRKTWLEAIEAPLTDTVEVSKNELACVDTATGLLTKGEVSDSLVPVGYFEENGTGDGSRRFRVRLFQGVWIHWFDNDAGGTPVVATDLLSLCYVLDASTVSGSNGAGARSAAGRVWAVDASEGVGVEMAGFSAGG